MKASILKTVGWVILNLSPFLFTSMFTSQAWGVETLDIKEFSGNYLNDQGEATAKVWQLPGEPSQSLVRFQVFKENTQFRLITPQQEFLFEDVPEFLLDLEQSEWDSLSAFSDGIKTQLSLKSLEGKGKGNSVRLLDLKGSCEGKNKNFLEDLIESCSEDGKLTFKSFYTGSLLRNGKNPLAQFFKNILSRSRGNTTASSVDLENFELKVIRSRFELKVKASLDISATVKAEGAFEYLQNPKSLKIRIDRVKASFLTITGKVFDELEKIQSENLVVSRPYVIISFP